MADLPMSSPAYIDTSVIINATSKDGNLTELRSLMHELQGDKVRIYTSIVTVQETSVAAFRKGGNGKDTHDVIALLARIVGITRDIAVEAARLEAAIRDFHKETPEESEQKQRRRWDCIHLASAIVLGCRHFYTTDKAFATRQRQLQLTSLQVLAPKARKPTLPFSVPRSTNPVTSTPPAS